jgi:hypothetical protein
MPPATVRRKNKPGLDRLSECKSDRKWRETLKGPLQPASVYTGKTGRNRASVDRDSEVPAVCVVLRSDAPKSTREERRAKSRARHWLVSLKREKPTGAPGWRRTNPPARLGQRTPGGNGPRNRGLAGPALPRERLGISARKNGRWVRLHAENAWPTARRRKLRRVNVP